MEREGCAGTPLYKCSLLACNLSCKFPILPTPIILIPPAPLLCSQVVFLPGTAGNQGGPHGKDANMGLPAQMFSRNDPTAEQPVEPQVGAGCDSARQGCAELKPS